jgi:predicted XRE-type DNA-binding protein
MGRKAEMSRKSPDHTVSSGNVFADLGLPGSDELMAKAALVHEIASIVGIRHLTQSEAARILGTTQPKVSDLLTGKLAGFSMERILRFLNALDRDVRITVGPKSPGQEHGSVRVCSAADPS